jgi:hypothetical protein
LGEHWHWGHRAIGPSLAVAHIAIAIAIAQSPGLAPRRAAGRRPRRAARAGRRRRRRRAGRRPTALVLLGAREAARATTRLL